MKHLRTAAPTLGSKINRLTFLIVGIVGIVAITGIFIFAQLNQKVRVRTAVNSLMQPAKSEVDLLIPTFILPEQKDGAKLILKKVVQEDNLELATIVSSEAGLPVDFSKCLLEDQSSCLSQDAKHVASVTAIRVGDQNFGYLFKTKNIDTTSGADQSLYFIEVIAGVLVLTFLALLWGMTRITARDVPNALKELATWVEEVLNDQGQSSPAPDLSFSELNELGRQITKIAEKYAITRDQAVVGQIAGGVMHDINTPLQPLLSAMELIEEKGKDDDTKKLKYLENLFKVTKSKLPVINSIVQTTLDGVRQIKVSSESANINDTIRKAISLSAEIVDLKTTELEFIEDENQTKVLHDPTQMTRVFTNLIKNSAEAQAQTEKSRIRISVTKKDGCPTVVVEDAGPGLNVMPDKIFHAFKSTKAHGSGLGLHASWKIVQAHGGSLVAGKSLELGGAQFEITLPAEEVPL